MHFPHVHLLRSNKPGGVVAVDYQEPDVRLSYHDQDSDGVYEGFDRFGRVVEHRWRDNDTWTYVDHFQHGYDRAGNRLWREHVNAAVPQDELYSYDHLHRLVDTQRGTLNAGRTALTAGSLALRQAWALARASALGQSRAREQTSLQAAMSSQKPMR